MGDGRAESLGCPRLHNALESCLGLTPTLGAPVRPPRELGLEALIHNVHSQFTRNPRTAVLCACVIIPATFTEHSQEARPCAECFTCTFDFDDHPMKRELLLFSFYS